MTIFGNRLRGFDSVMGRVLSFSRQSPLTRCWRYRAACDTSRRASPHFGQKQITLLSDWGTYVWTICPS